MRFFCIVFGFFVLLCFVFRMWAFSGFVCLWLVEIFIFWVQQNKKTSKVTHMNQKGLFFIPLWIDKSISFCWSWLYFNLLHCLLANAWEERKQLRPLVHCFTALRSITFLKLKTCQPENHKDARRQNKMFWLDYLLRKETGSLPSNSS